MSEELQKSAPIRRRRLVPDVDSQVIEVGGQKLTRVARIDDEPAGEVSSSIEGALREDYPEFLQALATPGDEPPAIADLASRLETYSDTGVIPNPETNPLLREGGTVSPLVTTEDAPDLLIGRSQPETLLDLFELFPQIDGINWFIYVERKAPRTHGGVPCTGVLRRITRPLSDNEWQLLYGGGEYKLIVYGPPKRALVLTADGRVAPKKMTEPILVRYPGAPSFESMVYDDEDPMTQNVEFGGASRRPMTISDAKVAEKNLDINAEREKRQEDKVDLARREADKLREKKEAEGNQILAQLMTLQRESSAREAELRREMLDREREIAEERMKAEAKWEERFRQLEQGSKKPDDVERVINLAKNMGAGSGQLEALREEHAREIARLTDARVKLEDTHQRNIKDERDRADRLIQDERQRADQRIKDAEDRFHNAEKQERERADREVNKAKEDAERRLSDMHRQHVDRIADMERAQQRDLQAAASAHVMQIETLKATYGLQLDASKGEIKRTQVEADRYKAEADANKDVVSKIAHLKEQAEALGMIDRADAEPAAAEPESLSQMFAKMAMSLVSNAPGIVENFASLARGKNQAELEQAQLRAREQMLMASQQAHQQQLPAGVQPLPPPHARRGQPRQLQQAPVPIAGQHTPPLIPGREPLRRPTRAERIEPIPGVDLQPEEIIRREEEERFARESQMAAPSPSMVPPPTMSPPAMPTFPQEYAPPVTESMMPPPQPPQHDPAAYEASAELRREDIDIMEAEKLLAPQFAEGADPAKLVAELAKIYSPEQIRGVLMRFQSPERVGEAVLRMAGPDHPFLSREGRKFLKGIFASLEKAAG